VAVVLVGEVAVLVMELVPRGADFLPALFHSGGSQQRFDVVGEVVGVFADGKFLPGQQRSAPDKVHSEPFFHR
jgi:hypothetical protein